MKAFKRIAVMIGLAYAGTELELVQAIAGASPTPAQAAEIAALTATVATLTAELAELNAAASN
jgi:hypothetical protein